MVKHLIRVMLDHIQIDMNPTLDEKSWGRKEKGNDAHGNSELSFAGPVDPAADALQK